MHTRFRNKLTGGMTLLIVVFSFFYVGVFNPPSQLLNVSLANCSGGGGTTSTGSFTTVTVTSTCTTTTSGGYTTYVPGAGGGGGIGPWGASGSGPVDCIQDAAGENNEFGLGCSNSQIQGQCLYYNNGSSLSANSVNFFMICPPNMYPSGANLNQCFTFPATGNAGSYNWDQFWSPNSVNGMGYVPPTTTSPEQPGYPLAGSWSFDSASTTDWEAYLPPNYSALGMIQNFASWMSSISSSNNPDSGLINAIDAFAMYYSNPPSGSTANNYSWYGLSMTNSFCNVVYTIGTTAVTQIPLSNGQLESCIQGSDISFNYNPNSSGAPSPYPSLQLNPSAVPPDQVPADWQSVNTQNTHAQLPTSNDSPPQQTIVNFPSAIGVTSQVLETQGSNTLATVTVTAPVMGQASPPSQTIWVGGGGINLPGASISCGGYTVSVTPTLWATNVQIDPFYHNGDVNSTYIYDSQTSTTSLPQNYVPPSIFSGSNGYGDYGFTSWSGCGNWNSNMIDTRQMGELSGMSNQPTDTNRGYGINVGEIGENGNYNITSPMCYASYGIDSAQAGVYPIAAAVQYTLQWTLSYTLNTSTVTDSDTFMPASYPTGFNPSNGGYNYNSGYWVYNVNFVNVNPYDLNCGGTPCVNNPAG